MGTFQNVKFEAFSSQRGPPLLLKKWWSGPYSGMSGTVLGLRIQSQRGYVVVVFLDATSIQQWLDYGKSSHYFATLLDNNCLFAVAVAYLSVSANKQTFFSKTRGSIIFLGDFGLRYVHLLWINFVASNRFRLSQ